MIIAVHAVAGAFIGSRINNPIIAFVLGFISHFILDMIPHHDPAIPTKGHSAKELRQQYFEKIVALIYLNITLGIIVTGAILTNNIRFITPAIIWGIIGSVLPDVFKMITFFSPRSKILLKINAFHDAIHYQPKNTASIILGNVSQILTLVLLVRPLV